MIKVSAPGKIHLLGEHTVVYGKPALLSAINLRVAVNVIANPKGARQSSKSMEVKDFSLITRNDLRKIIEPIIKKVFKIKTIPPYQVKISSQIPLGSGLGSSAAISAAYIAALLSFLKIKWDLNLINELTFEAEKVFHGNPSGGDNSAVVFGGLIWFRKETPNLKTIQPISVKKNRSKNFVLIHSGKPSETTRDMIETAKPKIKSILSSQENLTKQMELALKKGDGLIEIIKKSQKNLEKIGVVGKIARKIIKEIENLGGAAKISGAGGVKAGSGMLLCYHPDPKKLLTYAKDNNLEAFTVKLGEQGLREE